MANSISVNGKTTSVPDVYSYVTSGITNPPSPLDYGNVCIIDDGSLTASSTSTSGIAGTNLSGSAAIATFSNLQQYRSYIKDGALFQLGQALFNPSNKQGVVGANKVFYIKAAATTPSTATVTLTKGNIVFLTNEEGTVNNGVLQPQTYNATTLLPPSGTPTLTPATGTGTIPIGTYYYVVTALNAYGETLASNEQTVTTSTVGQITVAWTAVSGATSYRIYRGTTAGGESLYYTSAASPYIDLNGASTTATPPTINTAILGTTISNELAQGYSVRIEKGQSFGYALVFYKGTVPANLDTFNTVVPTYWSGALQPTTNLTPGVFSKITNAQVMFRSPDSYNIRGLQSWLTKSASIQAMFKSVTVNFTGTSNLDDTIFATDASQYTALAPYTLFTGGTETFNSTYFQTALTAVQNLNNTFFLATGYGANAQSTTNLLLLNLLNSGNLKYDKYMFVGGGQNATKFNADTTSSVQIAQAYNSQRVVVVHGAGYLSDTRQPSGFLQVSQLYKAALILGRVAGIQPQVPVTYKDIAITSDVDQITDVNKQIAINAGVTYTNFDNELNSFIVGYGLTTLQDNQFLVNAQGFSYDLAVERVKSQLNKAIIINAKRNFFGNNNSGANRNTVSTESITSWLASFLTAQVAKPEQDNLIISWKNINVSLQQDNIYVTFQFVPNTPISRIVFNGIMINS